MNRFPSNSFPTSNSATHPSGGWSAPLATGFLPSQARRTFHLSDLEADRSQRRSTVLAPSARLARLLRVPEWGELGSSQHDQS